jgi:hypothetical protein
MESLIIGILIIIAMFLGYMDAQEKMKNGKVISGQRDLWSYITDIYK